VASLFLSLFLIAFTIQPAKAQPGTIYINPDGSITPPTANITSYGNLTHFFYTFTGNNYLPIVVNRSNIMINGMGYLLQASGGNGFSLTRMDNVTIVNTTITNSVVGIWLDGSSGNVLSGNNVTENSGYGIELGHSSDNVLSDNNITANSCGIALEYSSDNNTLTSNIVAANSIYGIWLDSSSNNRIFHNGFLNNTQQTNASNSTEAWDDGYPSGGNYWSGYTGVDQKNGPYQNMTGSDGIGDTTYTICANNTDHYPLMGTFYSYEVHVQNSSIWPLLGVTLISNSTITHFLAPFSFEHDCIVFMSFNVTGKQGSTGFCRVAIPKDIMNVTFIVFVNGTEIPYTILSCSNANISYLYFTYTHSTKQVIITPEFPSFLILPLLMIITLLGAIAFKKRATKTRR
jgi:parallel beta-helix repeat protein